MIGLRHHLWMLKKGPLYCHSSILAPPHPTTARLANANTFKHLGKVLRHPGALSQSAQSHSAPSSPSAKDSEPDGASSSSAKRIFGPTYKFCRVCGSTMTHQVPPGEHALRAVCGACGYVDYMNPKMVVGCIVEHGGCILLARRAIEPARGLWTLPAGYMELNESSAEGAARETMEEANASVHILAPYAHWDIPLIGQAYIIFRASLQPPHHHFPGPESLETQLFALRDIPFDSLAFSSIAITLRLYIEDVKAGSFRFHHGVIDKQPGSLPNVPGTYMVRNHLALPIAPTLAPEHTQG